MTSLLERKLIVMTGKGGAGRSTIAAAVGLLAAERGLRTIVVEVGEQRHLPGILGSSESPGAGEEIELREGLWSLSIDPDRVLADWLRELGGRVPARVLGSSTTFQYFIAAAPGAREMMCIVKVWELAEGMRPTREQPPYDLVILDAPATGHALAMLRSPHTFAAIARVGPIASQSVAVRELLGDPARSGYLAIAQPTETAVAETFELRASLRETLGRELEAVIVNGMLPRRFRASELDAMAVLRDGPPPARAALGAARTMYERTRLQQGHLGRLRRRLGEPSPAGAGSPPRVLTVPFLFEAQLGPDAVRLIAGRLRAGL
jgi:anion-transporting  ArsA/GET3 family ATPase